MFDLSKQVRRLQQLKHDKIHGLPDKPKQRNPKVPHIDDVPFDITAQRESISISHSFHNHSLGFGRRLSKSKGQKHYPGGGFHTAITKGI